MPDFSSAFWFKGPTAADEGDPGGGSGSSSVPTHSLRFDRGSTSYLYRSLGSTDTTWTLSFWLKQSDVEPIDGNNRYVFSINDGSGLYWRGTGYGDGALGYYRGASEGVTISTGLYRDPTGWLHCCLVCDSGTADFYINGSIAPNMGSMSLSEDAVDEIRFGTYDAMSAHATSQYLHDIYFVEGAAVSADNFYETDSASGVIKPKVYDLSSAGSNSFHLANEAGHDSELLVTSDHADGSTLIYDSSGVGHSISRVGNTNHQDTVGNPFGSGSAIKFDGSGDYLTVPDSTSWTFGSGDFTIETWINFSAWESTNFNTIAWFGPVQIDHKRDGGTKQLRMYCYDSGGNTSNVQTWDASLDTWYHVAAVRDSGTLRLFVDGTSLGTETISTTLTDATGASAIMARAANSIGGVGTPDRLSTGYIYDFRVSKEAKYSANFTKPSAPFESNYIAVGADSSGNKLHFTPTNLNMHDVVPDLPTKNYATLSPLDKGSNTLLLEGNLGISQNSNSWIQHARSTFSVSSGKWYWECTDNNGWGGSFWKTGIAPSSSSAAIASGLSGAYTYYAYNGSGASSGSGWSSGDIIGIALDLDNGTCDIYKNNSSMGTLVASGLSGEYSPYHDSYNSQTIYNFGQDPTFVGSKTSGQDTSQSEFYYAPPSGFKALCSANLSATIADPSANFQIKTYDDGSGAKTFDGNSDLKPDLVWLKSRGSDYDHKLVDSVRGVTKSLESNSTDAEATESTGLTAFGTDGFTVGGYSGYSVDFDGSNDYCALGFNNPAASEMTYMGWIKTTDTQGVLIGAIDSSGQAVNTRGGIIWTSSKWYFTMGNGSSGYDYDYATHSASAILDGEWHHVAQVVDGASMKMYVDGSLDASFTSSQSAGAAGDHPLSIGRWGAYSGGYYTDGKIDEVAFFTSALSSSDITAIYNSGKPASLSSYSPYGWWRMGDNDEGSGTTITDQGSEGNDGTLYNGPTYSTDTPSDPDVDYTDTTDDGMVAWGWKAGTAFDAGGGSGTGSKNATAGFSIATWSGADDNYSSGSDTVVSHGLGVKPAMIIIMNRTKNAENDAYSEVNNFIWHKKMGGDGKFMRLNTGHGNYTWDSGYESLKTIGTSSFTVANGQYNSGTDYFLNWTDEYSSMGSGVADDYVAYCWAEVAGYSKFGSYTGNGSADGPVVHLGFRPAFLMIKYLTGSASAGYDWIIHDSGRVTYNHGHNKQLTANGGYEEGDDGGGSSISHIEASFDFLSNGFKVRNSYAGRNASGYTYIYAAFGEQAAKYSLAR